MSIRLYDSKKREVTELKPLKEGEISLYVCGPTVQDGPHLGHIRTFLAFDVLVRWLKRSGFKVTYIRNVTDIDDKILSRAQSERQPWFSWSLFNERKFAAIMRQLGCLEPDYEPRATGHITEMIDFITRLIERGHAYSDGDASVYFDVSSLESYGSLTRQSVENMIDDLEEAASGKQDPRDFALWKKAKAEEPRSAAWNTPYGLGRPGWHLECSAMALKYLGEGFDIHGGGLDLRFPHHENEQAQSLAAGYSFANRWLHAGMLTVDGLKMGKSLGNFITAEEALAKHSAEAIRFSIVSSHYRSSVEFNEATLHEAQTVLNRFKQTLELAMAVLAKNDLSDQVLAPGEGELPTDFRAALNDDLNAAKAIAVIHGVQTELNALLSDNPAATLSKIVKLTSELRDMLDVFGLDLEPKVNQNNAAIQSLEKIIDALLIERNEARAQKDWAKADQIRDKLKAANILIEDSPAGARWKIDDNFLSAIKE